MRLRERLKLNNKGATLIYVIVTAAMILLLGAATTVTAYFNLKTTQLQEKSDANFYNADKIANAVLTSVEKELSNTFVDVYTAIITNEDIMTNENANLKETYVNTMKEELFKKFRTKDAHGNATSYDYYDLDVIQKNVSEIIPDDTNYTISATQGRGYMIQNDDGITLANLHITYEDPNGAFDEITTDVRIVVPDIDLVPRKKTDNKWDLMLFNNGLSVGTGNGITINSDMYIQQKVDPDATNQEMKNAIYMNENSKLEVQSENELVVNGNIKTEGSVEMLLHGTGANTENEIWLQNINIGRKNNVSIAGTTYVADDLEINGSDSTVNLKGEYYGYGYSNEITANKNSSININGAKTTLNLTNLNKMLLAGTSRVSTSKLESGRESKNEDIRLGETLSIKSNQLAYLIDNSEFEEQVPGFSSNPMDSDQFNTAIFDDILNQKLEFTNYTKSYRNFDSGIQIVPVFSPEDGGTVYLYLKFSNENNAANYFAELSKSDSKMANRLRLYSAQYIEKMEMKKSTEVLANGNYLMVPADESEVFEYDTVSLINGEKTLNYVNQITEDNLDTISAKTAEIKNEYEGIQQGGTKTSGKKDAYLFKDVINEERLKKFIDGAKIAKRSHDEETNRNINLTINGIYIKNGDLRVYLIDNEGKSPYVLNETSCEGLVVATGDLIVDCPWTGAIIVKGRTTFNCGTKMQPTHFVANEKVVNRANQQYYYTLQDNVEDGMCVINIFNYAGCENVKPPKLQRSKQHLISECVVFERWNKD